MENNIGVSEAEMGAQESCNRLLHSMVFLCCFLFTLYQSYMCLLKYLSYPRGTSVEYKPPTTFPAITICSRYSERESYFPFKVDKLKECNIGRQIDKRYHKFTIITLQSLKNAKLS